MVKLQWKVNGRTVPANGIADELGKAVRAKIARVRCPTHTRLVTAQHAGQRQRRPPSILVREMLRPPAGRRQRQFR